MSSVDWQTWLRDEPDCRIDKSMITVSYADGRRQKIQVNVSIETIELDTRILSEVTDRTDVELLGLLAAANRTKRVIRFYLNQHELRAVCWLPTPVANRDEFLFLLRHLSRESDRLEFLLTGQDQN